MASWPRGRFFDAGGRLSVAPPRDAGPGAIRRAGAFFFFGFFAAGGADAGTERRFTRAAGGGAYV